MKNLLNLGKALNKAEQRSIIGGGNVFKRVDNTDCETDADCGLVAVQDGVHTQWVQSRCVQVSASGGKLCLI